MLRWAKFAENLGVSVSQIAQPNCWNVTYSRFGGMPVFGGWLTVLKCRNGPRYRAINDHRMLTTHTGLPFGIPSQVHRHAFHEVLVLALLKRTGRLVNYDAMRGRLLWSNRAVQLSSRHLLDIV